MGILSSVAKVLESPRHCDDSLASFSVHRATVTVSPQSHQGRESTLERGQASCPGHTDLPQSKQGLEILHRALAGHPSRAPTSLSGNFSSSIHGEGVGLGFTFVKFGGKENKATECSRAEERQRSMLSEGPARSVLLCCLPRRINRVGYSPSSGLRAVPPSLLSHPSCSPPMLLLPQLLLARRKADD